MVILLGTCPFDENTESGEMNSLPRVFVSHAGPDSAWAEWVSWQLSAVGYPVELDRWDWSAGDNFIEKMRAALESADLVIALYSFAYFDATRFSEDEWTSVLASRRRLVPLRVEEVVPPRLLRPIIYADLFGKNATDAYQTLMTAIAGGQRPIAEPAFPGQPMVALKSPSETGPRLPGSLPEVWSVPVRSPAFVGREILLSRLRETLNLQQPSAAIVLSGMHGIGKTPPSVAGNGHSGFAFNNCRGFAVRNSRSGAALCLDQVIQSHGILITRGCDNYIITGNITTGNATNIEDGRSCQTSHA
jgi:hypothetical protein